MALPLKRIKEKSVIVDEGIGEAIVKIVLHGKHRDEIKTIITRRDAISLLEKEGIEILGTIKNDQISNRFGEVTGTWIFKIPTTEPEYSTTTVVKRRNNKKKRENIVEEDWTVGPEQ